MTDVVFEFNQSKGREVALSDEFMESLFGISEKIHLSQKFRTRTNGVGRLYWHVTQADLMLMVTLHSCFNTEGILENVTRNQIYQRLQELYDDPCCNDQFYIAFEKFLTLGLVLENQSGFVSQFKLNHFMNPETNKLNRIVVIHPLFFTKQFTDLPVSSQKLVFDLVRKQGNDKDKEVFYWLEKGKGLFQLLHKKHVYELKKVLNLLSAQVFQNDTPLLRSWRIEVKKGSRAAKLVAVINSAYICQYKAGVQYRQTIAGKKPYRRVIRHLHNLLTEFMVGEYEYMNDGADFFQLVRLLKGKSYGMMRYVVEKIRELYEKDKKFPTDILDFIKDELRHKSMIAYLEIAKDVGIYKFICPRKLDDTRLFEFTSFASRFNQRAFKTLCRVAIHDLEQHYTRQPAFSHKEYARSKELERAIDVITLRSYAFSLSKCPLAYHDLELVGYHKMQQGLPAAELREWLLQQIVALPQWTLIPDTPLNFKVEEFIEQYHSEKTSA